MDSDLPTVEPIKVYENTYILKPTDSQKCAARCVLPTPRRRRRRCVATCPWQDCKAWLLF